MRQTLRKEPNFWKNSAVADCAERAARMGKKRKNPLSRVFPIEFMAVFVYNSGKYRCEEEGPGLADVLAVISGKGGTGKTSLCAAIASCMAMEGLRVLCIDLDVGLRNLDIALGMSDVAVIPFTAVMRGEYSLQQASAHPTIANLHMLTAPVTERAEDIDEAAFASLIGEARTQYDWILLDAPAGVGTLFRLAVRCADEAVVVTLAGPAAQRDAARAAELMLLERSIPARLIVNRASPRMFARMHATVDDVMDGVGLPLIGVVPDDASVTLAAAEGKPLVQYTFRGAALASLHIAQRLLGRRVPLMKI